MFTVAVRRSFIAQHYLIGGDWGKENEKHSHNYIVEVILEGKKLDEHGYLVDITEIEARLNETVARFKGITLNDLPEFAGMNPSIERLANLFCSSILHGMRNPPVSAVRVKISESDNAWASCRQDIS
jgi:6-pyruvoyltetrahydropterin/6-carboxytetrahydropterin synthase